jgi:hypothetical protein
METVQTANRQQHRCRRQKKFEPVKPSHSGFTPFGKFLKNLVAVDAFIVANCYFGAVRKSISGTFAETDRI